MHIRRKGEKLRITLADANKPQNINYVTIDPQVCWSATFNAWGKKAAAPIVKINGEMFRIVLQSID